MTGQVDVVELKDQKQVKGIVLSTIPLKTFMIKRVKCGVKNDSVLLIVAFLLRVCGFRHLFHSSLGESRNKLRKIFGRRIMPFAFAAFGVIKMIFFLPLFRLAYVVLFFALTFAVGSF